MRDHQTGAEEREVEDWQAEMDYQIDDEVVGLENVITRISRGLRQAVGIASQPPLAMNAGPASL